MEVGVDADPGASPADRGLSREPALSGDAAELERDSLPKDMDREKEPRSASRLLRLALKGDFRAKLGFSRSVASGAGSTSTTKIVVSSRKAWDVDAQRRASASRSFGASDGAATATDADGAGAGSTREAAPVRLDESFSSSIQSEDWTLGLSLSSYIKT